MTLVLLFIVIKHKVTTFQCTFLANQQESKFFEAIVPIGQSCKITSVRQGYDYFCLLMPDVGNDELLHVNDENHYLFG